MSPSVAAAQYQFVAAANPTHDSVVACVWIPIEAESWLEVVVIATRYWSHDESWIVIGSCHHRLVELHQIANRLSGVLVSQTQRDRKVRSNFPLVLTKEEEVMPIAVQDTRSTGQVLVDVGSSSQNVDQKIQSGVLEQTPGGGFEKLMQLITTAPEGQV